VFSGQIRERAPMSTAPNLNFGSGAGTRTATGFPAVFTRNTDTAAAARLSQSRRVDASNAAMAASAVTPASAAAAAGGGNGSGSGNDTFQYRPINAPNTVQHSTEYYNRKPKEKLKSASNRGGGGDLHAEIEAENMYRLAGR
jgi:hypothetical protein